MTVIINAGSAVSVTASASPTITDDGTGLAGGLLDCTGAIIGPTLSPTIVVADVNLPATLASDAEAAACFVAGTRVRIARGDVPIERLAVGDIVLARFAGTTPVVWIGHRHVDCRRHPVPARVMPVRVSAHAFAPRMPERDLLLSPDHAVFVADVLIPVRYLINGRTIRMERVDRVTYYHVELAEHDVLLAEGLPVESYLDNGDRHVFDNGGEMAGSHPALGPGRREALSCVPLVVAGARLDAIQAMLCARIPRRRMRQAVSLRIP
jgi:hypothetical protein